ncbi:hypothetical protein SS50377_27335 [Spironucleus salmonicida]|nr:hypothetical protein SS50377_27335 [Spironucleus salmonicida]
MRKQSFNINNTDVLFFAPKSLQKLYCPPPIYENTLQNKLALTFVQLPQQTFVRKQKLQNKHQTSLSTTTINFEGKLSQIDYGRSFYKPRGGEKMVFMSKSLII